MKRDFRTISVAVLATGLAGSLVALYSGCGSSSTTAAGPNVYGSTSSTGDFAQWTSSNGTVSVVWNQTDSSGNITKTITASAACGAADPTYGYQTCTISSGATCTSGTQTCGASDAPAAGATFQTIEIPGVAILVHMGSGGQAGTGGSTDQVHVGFTINTTCTQPGGTFVFSRLGVAQKDLFGIYQTGSNFSSITHASFYANDATSGTCGGAGSGRCTQTPVWALDEPGSQLPAQTTTNVSCTAGVWSFGINGMTVRAVQSSGGTFILDLPAGQGGIVGLPVAQAAQASDFANKQFYGIVFPDESSPSPMSLTTGSISGTGAVPITSLQMQNGTPSLTSPVFEPFTTAASSVSSPAFPDGTAAVSGFSSSPLYSSYPTPSTFPGLFKVDATSTGDDGRVVLVATVSNGHTLAFGTNYNWRINGDNGFTGTTGYVNAGAFVLFSK